MKPKHLGWLLVATFLVWFMPWQAKQLFPTVFGSSYIQWASAIISAPLLSVGLFLSVHALYTHPKERRDSGWACIGFTTLFCLILGFYGLASPILSRLSHSVDTLSLDDSMPRLMPKMQEAKTEKHRQTIAKTIYLFNGVTVPYQTDSGTYIIYNPTQEDTNSWTQTQALESKRKETKALLEWTLKQLPWLTFLYIGSFFLTFLVGSLILIYRKNKSDPSHSPKLIPPTAPEAVMCDVRKEMNPEVKSDWRLTDQEYYIRDKVVRLQKFCVPANRERSDHEHCIFCWQKIVEDPSKYPASAELITEAYTTEDEKHWICPTCFSDFQASLQLRLKK